MNGLKESGKALMRGDCQDLPGRMGHRQTKLRQGIFSAPCAQGLECEGGRVRVRCGRSLVWLRPRSGLPLLLLFCVLGDGGLQKTKLENDPKYKGRGGKI